MDAEERVLKKREYKREWRAKNRDRLRKYHKKYREENRERIAATQARYWQKQAKNRLED